MTQEPESTTVKLTDPSLYINRELSWLEFNRRVLEEASDPTVPLMERLKFLAIFESNLDEFFMVRVGGWHQKVQSGVLYGSGADRTPCTEVLEEINQVVREMNEEKHKCFSDLLPVLRDENIVIRGVKDLTDKEKKYIKKHFQKDIYPVLTPMAIDQGHPFPRLLNKTLNLAVLLKRPKQPEELFAVVQVPSVLPRFVDLPGDKGHAFVPLEVMIRLHLSELFPGMELISDTAFRVTRNNDFEIDDDDVEDLLKTIEEEVRKRRRGEAVRLQIEAEAPKKIEQFLVAAFALHPQDVYRNPALLDLTGLFQICSLPGYPHLRDPSFVPQLSPDFTMAPNIWTAIRSRDILLHHPYESFSHVVDFVEAAANDENVLAIKQTLYRTSSDSPIIRALQRAADNGKQVTAVVELKARLDEEKNIAWARELEKAGVHVVYGFVGLKTHCKVCLVVRREEGKLHRYVHLGTGNYNPQTAKIYTDLAYFTCDDALCEDATALFNYLTGYCELPQWNKLVVAPSRLQNFMIEKIDEEIAHQQAGRKGRIVAKINGLLEPAMVKALYRASQAGVKIDLICRGICALRPGIPGVSENIRVISIVDRFLEHSRIFYFANGGQEQVYIGSADWMDRNLSRRVEVVFEVDETVKKRVVDEILALGLSDNVKARELLPTGKYRRVVPQSGEEAVRSQEVFLYLAVARAEESQLSTDTRAEKRQRPTTRKRSRRDPKN